MAIAAPQPADAPGPQPQFIHSLRDCRRAGYLGDELRWRRRGNGRSLQMSSKELVDRSPKVLHCSRFWRHALCAVIHARYDCQLALHTARPQAFRVRDALVVEQIEIPDSHPRRWQPRQIWPASWRSVLGCALMSRMSPEIRSPGEAIRRRRPHQPTPPLRSRPQNRTVVDHRAKQNLSTWWIALVVAALRDGSRETSTSTGTHDCDPLRINTELVGLVTHPLQRRHAIVKSGRERIFRCQSIVGHDNNDSEVSRNAGGVECLELRRAGDHSATVDPQNRRPRHSARDGCYHPHLHRRMTHSPFCHNHITASLRWNPKKHPMHRQCPRAHGVRDERQHRTAEFLRYRRQCAAPGQIAARRGKHQCGDSDRHDLLHAWRI